MEIKRMMLVGAGLMGGGIAQVAAQNGHNIVLNNMAPESVDKELNTIAKNLDGQVKKEKMTAAQKDDFLADSPD
jgi:3-hydroxybutyryl-CoA dehydrogenase